MIPLLFLLLFIFSLSSALLDIRSFGAVPNNASAAAAFANSRALLACLRAANASGATDRTVLVPGPGLTFDILHVGAAFLSDVTLRVDGRLRASALRDRFLWPVDNRTGGDEDWAVLQFADARRLRLTGAGTIDGQGYGWWLDVIAGHPDERPHLVICERCDSLRIDSITAVNSPQFHFKLIDVRGCHVHDVTVFVDVDAQASMTKRSASGGLPTFPLNTDGFDPSGVDVLIERVTVTNFDDAVAVKPNTRRHRSPCTRRVVVRDARVFFSVGMSVGSVPPSPDHNCIDDVQFVNVSMVDPIKAIYVKSNPGTVGSGQITNIVYRNLTGTGAIWYPIYIGPQQQHQPNTTGNPCSFLFALDPTATCETNPLVLIANVSLIDVSFAETLLVPGVVWCDPVTPCTGVVFDNVRNAGPFGLNSTYRCQNVVKPRVLGATSPTFATCE
jgi:polygalacturonase